MPIAQISYATSLPYSITIANLADSSAREGAFIDNTSTLYLDAMMYFSIQLQIGTPASDRVVNFWFYASEDGTNYTDNATGTNAPITLRNPNNFRGPWTLFTPDAGGITYKTVIPSVAAFFGGNLPRRWGVVIENRTGLALNATEGNHTKSWTGLTLIS